MSCQSSATHGKTLLFKYCGLHGHGLWKLVSPDEWLYVRLLLYSKTLICLSSTQFMRLILFGLLAVFLYWVPGICFSNICTVGFLFCMICIYITSHNLFQLQQVRQVIMLITSLPFKLCSLKALCGGCRQIVG